MKSYFKVFLRLAIFVFASLCFFSLQNVHAQQQKPFVYKPLKRVPPDSIPLICDLGAGLGMPYGILGIKGTVGVSPVGIPAGVNAGLGVGILPFANEIALNPVVEFMGLDRFAVFRPKISATYSSIAGAIMLMDQDLDMLYFKKYSGFGIYLGGEIRPFNTLPIAAEANIGWITLRANKDEMLSDLRVAYDSLKTNYDFSQTPEKMIKNLNTPKISIGITFTPRRVLKETYDY